MNSNWSDLEWIEIYPRTTEPYRYIVKDKIHYQIYQTPNTQVIDDEYQAITRKPTDQELASGFALDEVIYYTPALAQLVSWIVRNQTTLGPHVHRVLPRF